MIFLCETTQNDNNRLLYKFENDQNNFGCVGWVGCGYEPASVKRLHCKFTKVWKQVIMYEDKVDKIKSEFTDL